MNIINSYELIEVGLLTRWLISVDEDDNAEHVLEHLIRLKDRLKTSSLKVSYSALTRAKSVTDIEKELKNLSKDNKIGLDLKNRIREEMGYTERTIFSESITHNIYIVSARRYNSEYLLKSPEKLLKDNIFGKLSDIAKFDFAAACRCLSFGEPTACAFHILRATEDTLKEMYFKFKKTNRLAKPMWGNMTSELRAKKNPKPNETILNALDVVRVSYRNPTQHPQVTYDIDSCQDLFGVCIDLINKMAAEI